LERRRTGQAAGDIVGSATLGGSATYEYGSCNPLKQARHRLTYLLFCVLPLDIAEPEHQRPSGWCDRQFGSHSTWVQRYRAVLMTWVRHQRRQPSGRGPAPAARLDRRGRHRPIRRGGRGQPSWGQACGGPRRPRLGRRGARASSQLDQRRGERTRVRSMAAFHRPASVQRCLTSMSISCDTATAVPSSRTARQVPTTGP
jgi:hypothetical protein